MNKVFKLYLTLFIITPIIIHTESKQEKNESPQILMLIKSENKNLATIADNALFLVHQIQKNNRNEIDRKRALKNIDITLKKVSNDIKNKLLNSISLIKKESNAFASHRKPLQKYSSLAAEQALKNLTDTIKKIAENKSEITFIEAQQKLLQAISQTEAVEKETIIAINKAQEQLRMGVIDFIEAAKIIGEQHYLLNAAKRSLQKEISQALEQVKQSDIQTNYLSQFSTAVHNLASRAIAPFKAGYWSTEKEKEIAQHIIEELETQLIQETSYYENELAQAKNDQERLALQQNYEAITQKINNEIYQQKIITGEVMSTNRKLFWTAVLAAGALTAGILGYKYLTAAPTEVALPPLTASEQSTSEMTQQAPSQPEQLVSEQIVEPTEILPQNIVYEPIKPTKQEVVQEVSEEQVQEFEEGIEKIGREEEQKEEEQATQEVAEQKLPEIPVTEEPTEITEPEYTDILGPEKTTPETIERLAEQNEAAAKEQEKETERVEKFEDERDILADKIEGLDKTAKDKEDQLKELAYEQKELEKAIDNIEADRDVEKEKKRQLEKKIEEATGNIVNFDKEQKRVEDKIKAIEDTLGAEEELAKQEKSQEPKTIKKSTTTTPEEKRILEIWEETSSSAPLLKFPETERPQF